MTDSVLGARIPLSWIICFVILSVFFFFSYHILVASYANTETSGIYEAMGTTSMVAMNAVQQQPAQQPALSQMAKKENPKGDPQANVPLTQQRLPLNMPSEFYKTYEKAQMPSIGLSQQNEPLLETTEQPAPSMNRLQKPPVPKAWPKIPAMTEEELRTPEPLQRTPPSVLYDDPEASDPLNKIAYMDAEFGSNLRHPEQMIERRVQAPGMGRVVSSGLGSEISSPGVHNADGYSPEMVQNGGRFMSNVSAWDGSTLNEAYSMI